MNKLKLYCLLLMLFPSFQGLESGAVYAQGNSPENGDAPITDEMYLEMLQEYQVVREGAVNTRDWIAKQLKTKGPIIEIEKQKDYLLTAIALLAILSQGVAPDNDAYQLVATVADQMATELLDEKNLPTVERLEPGVRVICLLTLSQVYGETAFEQKNSRLWQVTRELAERVVQLQVKEGIRKGSWANPESLLADDLGNTLLHVLALRGAEACGVNLPSEWRPRTLGFLKRCETENAQFRPSPEAADSTPAANAAGILLTIFLQLEEADAVSQELKALSQMQLPTELRNNQPGIDLWLLNRAFAVAEARMMNTPANEVERLILDFQAKDGRLATDKALSVTIENTCWRLLALTAREHALAVFEF
jgi:hypothetical protein